MAKDIFEQLAENKKLYGTYKPDVFDIAKREWDLEQLDKENGGYWNAGIRGLKSSSSGVLWGANPTPTPRNQSFGESLVQDTASLIGDLPVMAFAGAAASPTGPFGAGAAAFAAPTAIKQGAKAKKAIADSGDYSFGNTFRNIGTAAKETAKSGIVGAATVGGGKLLGIASKAFPKLAKVLEKPVVGAATKLGAEMGGITAGHVATEWELPSAKDTAKNFLLIGAMKFANKIPGITRDAISKGSELAGKTKAGKYIKEFVKKDKHFTNLKEAVGTRDVRTVKTSMLIDKLYDKITTEEKKISKQDRSDAIYYMQKTGNPKIKGDTFIKLEKRMSPEAKSFSDNVAKPYFESKMEMWNKQKRNKDINPREYIEDTYLPGMYKYDKAKFDALREQKAETGKFTNKKTFDNYKEAIEKAKLEPKYNDIVKLMKAYEKNYNKSMFTNEMLDYTKKQQNGVILNNQPKKYRLAKEKGYVPFEDPLLKKFRNKSGEYEISHEPALVEPKLASSIRGVFNKNRPTKISNLEKGLMKLKDEIRFMNVKYSPFHYGAITESSAAVLGPLKALNFPEMAREGKRLRSDPEAMAVAAESGLQIPFDAGDKGIEGFERNSTYFDKGMNKLKKMAPHEITKKFINALQGSSNYLFEQYIPNVKIVSFNHLLKKMMTAELKQNPKMSKARAAEIARDSASLTNDMFGGQQWETQKIMNRPEVQRAARALISYPDWTSSAARQALAAFGPGIRGQMGRRYWAKYIANTMMFNSALRWMFGGWGNDKDGNVRFNINKANKAVLNPDSFKSIPLPDFNFKIGNKTINIGRDENGKKLYMHNGKQAYEIMRYFSDPGGALFGKSNPLIRIAYKQLFSGTPWNDKHFPARAKYKYGEQRPWDATKPGTPSRYLSRGKELVTDILPFGMQALAKNGILPTMASGGGIFSVTKGSNKYTKTDAIESAVKTKDMKGLKNIVNTLEENGNGGQGMRSRISQIITEPLTKAVEKNKKVEIRQYQEMLRLSGATERSIKSKMTRIKKKLIAKNRVNELPKPTSSTSALLKLSNWLGNI